MRLLVSIDAETNGLWGYPFAVALVVYNEDGKGVDQFVGRCPIEGTVDGWVAENVLPAMEGIPVTHPALDALLADAAAFWLKYKSQGAEALWHMGHVVEAYLFRLMVERGYLGMWDAPYTPVEVAEILRCKGFAPDSVDSAAEKLGLPKPQVVGGTHNPLYDAEVAATVYFALKAE